MQIRIYTIFISLALLFFSCGTDDLKISKPKNLISKEKMAEILADIHIAESSIVYEHKDNDSIDNYTIAYYYYIFDIYNIDKETFLESINYYLLNLDDLNEIYTTVNEILNTKQGEKW